MWQAMAAKAGMDALGSMLSSGMAHVQAIQQATAQEQNNEDAWIANSADNKAIAEANLQNSIRTAYRSGILNMQRGQSKKRQAELGIGLGRSKLQALSATTANSAATGSIGASVDAVLSDINMQAENADASLVESARVEDQNYHLELTDMLKAGEDALRDPTKINIRKVVVPEKTSGRQALVAGLLGAGSSYASAYMSSGFGKSATEAQGMKAAGVDGG